jgi:hypothetical protein
MQPDDAEREPGKADLGAEGSRSPDRGCPPGLGGRMRDAGRWAPSPIVRSKNPTTRRSYSAGAASIAPVCPPGASQYSFGPFAAS